MAHPQTTPVGHFLRRLSVAHLVAAAPDDELVERFAVYREEAAFAALVRRHGPLVLGVCRRVLTDPHAAEDCFQATFLVLACQAGSLKEPRALGSWLYGVATRTALKARARAARRCECERRAAVAEAVAPSDGLIWRDLRPRLDEAIAGLPEKHRTPFVLHHLEGLTVAEVAHQLGCPQGTISARLARAKEQLRARLARQGLAWCIGALGAAITTSVSQGAAVSLPLAAGTVAAAMRIAGGEVAGALPAAAAALTSGGLGAMCVSKVKVALAVLLAVSALGIGVGVSQHARPSGAQARSGRGSTPADGGQQPGGDALVCGRHYAGGLKCQNSDVLQRQLGGIMYQQAEKDFKMAEFYQRTDHPESAYFYYEIVRRRYPGTKYADMATDRMPLLRAKVNPVSTGSLMFGVGVNSDAGLTGSIVLNERNFDLPCLPLSTPECHSPTKSSDALSRMAFLDGGTVQRTARELEHRAEAGAGLRMSVPTLGPVPIALDFGFPVGKGPEASGGLFSFWVGFLSQ